MLWRKRKKLSQYWLINDQVIAKIVNLVNVQPPLNLLEIGAGTGNITCKLARLPFQTFTAIEIDRILCDQVAKKLENVKLICEDALKFSYDRYESLTIVSNLPYHLTSQLLLKFTTHSQRITAVILMVPTPVCDKLLLPNNALMHTVNAHFRVSHIQHVPKYYSSPMPIVSSEIVQLTSKRHYSYSLHKFIRNLYNRKHKKCLSVIENQYPNKSRLTRLNKDIRVHQLNTDQLISLYREVSGFDNSETLKDKRL